MDQDARTEKVIAAEREIRDREAETYDAHIGRVPYVRAIEDEWIFSALGLTGTETVLDAGCATGRHLKRLLDEAQEVVGADHSQRSIEIARTNVPEADADRIRLVTADLRQLPLESESVDAVLCSGVLQHIPTRRARLDTVYELSRVLRPGGVATFVVYRWLGHIRRDKEGSFNSGLYRYAFTRHEFAELLEKGGFSHVNAGGAVILPGIAERVGVSVSMQRRLADAPVARSLGHYVVARAVKPV